MDRSLVYRQFWFLDYPAICPSTSWPKHWMSHYAVIRWNAEHPWRRRPSWLPARLFLTYYCPNHSTDQKGRHIFCLPCADRLGLSKTKVPMRQCPACETMLPNPDDAVSTILNPTEDYKSSVLSGLDPSTIVDCAGRALSFWVYQTTQEMYVSSITLGVSWSLLKKDKIAVIRNI